MWKENVHVLSEITGKGLYYVSCNWDRSLLVVAEVAQNSHWICFHTMRWVLRGALNVDLTSPLVVLFPTPNVCMPSTSLPVSFPSLSYRHLNNLSCQLSHPHTQRAKPIEHALEIASANSATQQVCQLDVLLQDHVLQRRSQLLTSKILIEHD